MAEKLRLRSNGNSDVYLYVESDVGASFAAGGDTANAVFAFNTSASADIEPDGSTAQLTLDPTANGNITIRPHGTGDSLFAVGDVNIQNGNLLIPQTNAAFTEGVIKRGSSPLIHFHSSDFTNAFVGEDAGSNQADRNCTGMGANALASLVSGGLNNTALGANAGLSITDGDRNTVIGYNAGSSIVQTVKNVILGSEAYSNGNGDRNVIIGYLSGSSYTGTESDNILIGDSVVGSVGENAVLRIGQATGLGNSRINKAIIHGIYGRTPAGGSQRLLIMDSNSQLGTTTGGSFTTNSYTTDSGSATPSSGIIQMLGGSNIGSTGSGNSVTFNLDDTVSISGSMTAGTGLTATTGDITASAGNLALPDPNAGGTQGVITVNGTRVFTYLGGGTIGVGKDAMNLAETGSLNIALGSNALAAITTGSSNVAIGANSQPSQVSGTQNVAIGRNSLFTASAGDFNVAVGNDSLKLLNNAAADFNTAIGDNALFNLASGASNTALGYDAGLSATGASSSNIYIRNVGAAESNTIRIGTQGTGNGQQDTAFIAGITSQEITGNTSLPVVIETTGQLGVAGNLNLPSTTSTAGQVTINSNRFLHNFNANTFVGTTSGNFTTTGSVNTAVGSTTLSAITSGNSNSAIGHGCMGAMQTGDANVAVGRQSLSTATQGDDNVAIGNNSLLTLNGATADGNVAVGFDALRLATTGNLNTAVGFDSLRNVVTGVSNTALGSNTGTNLTTSDSSNVLIRSAGVTGDNNTIRIGTQGTGNGQQDTTFIAGIYGVTPGGTLNAALIDNNGQLGSVASLGVANGGTGAATLTDHGVLVGSGTSAITALAVGTDGQVLVGSTGADPVFATISSTDGTIDVTGGAGTLDLGLSTLPAFLAYNSADDTNQTGNGATPTVDFDTEVFDQGGDFAADTFTAPVTGIYRLEASVSMSNFSLATSAYIQLVTTARTYYGTQCAPLSMTDASGNLQLHVAVLADMTATDTAHVVVVASGEVGDTVTINGSASPHESYFSGSLVR